MEKRQLWKTVFLYYGIAIAITWTLSLLIILKILPTWMHYLNAYGPLVAAVIMLRKNKDPWKTLWTLKKWPWFLIGGTSPLWASALIYGLIYLSQGSLPDLSQLGEISFLGNIGGWAFPLWIVTFGLGEELGWRGFLLPELQKKYSLLVSTLILWVFWSLWHLPFFFYLPTYLNMNVGALIGFLFSLFSGTIFLSWLFRQSGRNLPTLILWHGAFNLITASTFGNGVMAMGLSMIIMVMSIGIFLWWIIRPTSQN